jgi:hypothetical protein
MWATLAAEVLVLTRPTYSSMSFGLLPADWMRVGWEIRVGMDSGFGLALSLLRLRFGYEFNPAES